MLCIPFFSFFNSFFSSFSTRDKIEPPQVRKLFMSLIMLLLLLLLLLLLQLLLLFLFLLSFVVYTAAFVFASFGNLLLLLLVVVVLVLVLVLLVGCLLSSSPFLVISNFMARNCTATNAKYSQVNTQHTDTDSIDTNNRHLSLFVVNYLIYRFHFLVCV